MQTNAKVVAVRYLGITMYARLFVDYMPVDVCIGQY